jgi:hypothetical protein
VTLTKSVKRTEEMHGPAMAVVEGHDCSQPGPTKQTNMKAKKHHKLQPPSQYMYRYPHIQRTNSQRKKKNTNLITCRSQPSPHRCKNEVGDSQSEEKTLDMRCKCSSRPSELPTATEHAHAPPQPILIESFSGVVEVLGHIWVAAAHHKVVT